MNKNSITIIIAAYNEEKYIAQAIREIDNVVKSVFSDYELLIFDDCSSDRTGEIADALARGNPKIRVLHNKRNRGLGYNYRKGVQIARKKYIMLLPADGGILSNSIKTILEHAGMADIIIAYTANKEARPISRRTISYCFTSLLNLLFGLNLKYYNGMVLYETKLVRKTKMTTNSFAFQAEILIQLIKRGYSYKEIPMYVRERKGKKTNILKIKNLVGVLKIMALLFLKNIFKNSKNK